MSTKGSMSTIKEARELYDLKEKAAKFYSENGVPQKMEEILNSMFYENPNDVYGHLVTIFFISIIVVALAWLSDCEYTVLCSSNFPDSMITVANPSLL